jgi:acyl-CoA synthetase (AMP-forming)/AMP-acid ligase II
MPFPDFEPTIPVLLERVVARHGPRTFVVLGDQRLTFAEADARSGELARGLIAGGVGKGTRVGVLLPNGPTGSWPFSPPRGSAPSSCRSTRSSRRASSAGAAPRRRAHAAHVPRFR